MRIGSGIDVHRLIRDTERPLMLGGVEIPSEWALEGHSDADALLHALTDAILGAMGSGDIGDFFPPSDPQWKNASSEIFLRLALDGMRKSGYRIGNIDCTIVSEVPKIGPHKTAIRERLEELMDLGPFRVGLKATTAEGLGHIGRSEGLWVQVTVLLEPAPPPGHTAFEPAEDEPALVPAGPARPPAKLAKTEADIPKGPERIEPELFKKIAEKDLATKPPARPATPKVLTLVKEPKPKPPVGGDAGGTLRIWADGACRGNPGPSSVGVVLENAEGLTLHELKLVIGTATNNVAEYRALIAGLKIAAPLWPEMLEVRMDSELVIKQMKGEYKVKDSKLIPLNKEARELADEFPAIRFIHVRREENRRADALANEALDEA